MDETDKLNFDCLCRTCMHQVSATNTNDDALLTKQSEQQRRRWQSIFDTIEECGGLCIAEVLTSTVPLLQVQLYDELPKQICHKCLDHLISIYHFQQTCLKAEEKMLELLNKKHTEIKVSTTETTEPAAVVDISRKELQMQNEEQRALIEPANSFLPKMLSMTIDDPLQSVDSESNVIGKDMQTGVSKCLKKELDNDDESSAEYDDYEATNHTIDDTLKIERLTPTLIQERTERGDGSDSNIQSSWLSKTSENHDITRSTVKAGAIEKNLHNAHKKSAGSTSSIAHTCTLCNKNFSTRRYLQRHLRRHKKADEQTNMYTNQPVSDGQQDQHIRLQCDICGRQYRKLESLHKHRLTHNDTEAVAEKHSTNYACDLCGKLYGSQRTLTRHKRQRHCTSDIMQESTKLYTCKFCNKGFQQSGTLKDHLRTHTGEQPYLCSECGRAFNSASNMKQHLLRHTGLKRYECPDCPKKFPCLSDLSSHKAVHRRIKPHICDICGSAFGKPYQLKKHKMYHNGEKPYKCEYCEMRFVCMDHQRRHMRTHTGEKPYKCKYCERAFAQSNDLIKHLRTHLGENVYKCDLCPSAYRLATELRVHFAMHKNDNKETRERNMKALMEEEAKLHLNLEAKKIKYAVPAEPSNQREKVEHNKITTVKFDVKRAS